MRFIAITTLVLATQGCSFMFVRGPQARMPEAHESPGQIRCTRSNLWPIVDGALSFVLLANAMGELLGSSSDAAVGWQAPRPPPEALQPSVAKVSTLMVLTAAAFASTTYGFTRVSDCWTVYERAAAQPRVPWVPIEQTEVQGQ